MATTLLVRSNRFSTASFFPRPRVDHHNQTAQIRCFITGNSFWRGGRILARAGSRADDSAPFETSMENALGVSESASFDDILRAKNSILATCKDEQQAIAKLVLSAIFGMLFTRMTSPEFLKFIRRWKYLKELKKWKDLLLMLQAVVADAEEKQLADKGVRMWLNDLKDLAYDAEDVLDEFITGTSQHRFMADDASSYKVRYFRSSAFAKLSLSAIKFHFRMESQIRLITGRLESISQQADKLGLKNDRDSQYMIRRTPSTCLPDEARICGRGEDKKKIVEMVLRDDIGGDGTFHVIPIVGMEGVGKTTLAQLVYNDKALCFLQPKVWVSLSDDFDALRTAKAILESVTFQPCKLKEFNLVLVRLREALARKKFLLVLDDLCSQNYGLWEALRSPLSAGDPGSTIIVTSSSLDVALQVGTVGCYKLNLLSDDDCWYVFLKHAFKEDIQSSEAKNVALIRNKVVERCGGLPLAAKSLGSLLRCKPMIEWDSYLSRKIWNLPDECDLFPLLRQGVYHQLPPDLKRCFAYSAVLVKHYDFEEQDIVPLWMAEGLVPHQECSKRMEETGHEFFHKLVSLSIYKVSATNISLYSMHNLLNELAQWASGEAYHTLDDELGAEKEGRLGRVRYTSYVRSDCDGNRKFEVFHKLKGLRTFLPFCDGRTSYVTNNLLHQMPNMRRLRVLNLSGYKITKLPSSIGGLKHLRYLNLSSTLIRSLPESTGFLYNLQSLILRHCSELTRLPSTMENLINLLILDITGVYLMIEMPPGIQKLKHLRLLSDFFIGSGSGCAIEELMNLNLLKGTIRISQLENVVDARCAYQANLRGKKYLDALELKWRSDFDDSRSTGLEKDVLDMLRPHKMLKELIISYYGGIEFPIWVGDPAFSSMVLVRLENCENCTSLPPLGFLKSLKDLVIKGMSGIQSIGSEIYGQNCSEFFLSLETLHFENMLGWRDWHINDKKPLKVFPKLRKLSILNCAQLLGNLPDHLPSLKELVITECKSLSVKIPRFLELCLLNISGCQEVVCTSVDEFSVVDSVVLSNISNFTSLFEDFAMKFHLIENLEIVGCRELTNLCQNRFVHQFGSLSSLKLNNCSQLVCLGTKEQLALPISLEKLEIRGCRNLKQPLAFQSLVILGELHVQNCTELVSLARNTLPSTLATLYISDCENLQFLLEEVQDLSISSTCRLEFLYIKNCPVLTCLSSQGEFPASLRQLEIWDCPEIESIAKSFSADICLEQIKINSCGKLKLLPESLNEASHLHEIRMHNCPNFLYFPQGGLPSNLRKLYIGCCQKLKSLPKQIHSVSSLQELEIHACPGIQSFPEEGLPSNLTILQISNFVICMSLFQWGLHRFAYLRRLLVHGGCSNLKSFPQEEMGMILPTSLNSLSIVDFPNIVELSSVGFQHLTSLEELRIHNCPKLKFLPENGLPSSILKLNIYRCPVLEHKLKRKVGKEWLKIVHIPCLYIDRQCIYYSKDDQLSSDETCASGTTTPVSHHTVNFRIPAECEIENEAKQPDQSQVQTIEPIENGEAESREEEKWQMVVPRKGKAVLVSEAPQTSHEGVGEVDVATSKAGASSQSQQEADTWRQLEDLDQSDYNKKPVEKNDQERTTTKTSLPEQEPVKMQKMVKTWRISMKLPRRMLQTRRLIRFWSSIWKYKVTQGMESAQPKALAKTKVFKSKALKGN